MTRPLGILAALPQEIDGLIERMGQTREVTRWGGRDFHRGMLHGHDCVIALSRIGKVAAAVTATTMITRYDVAALVFIGVAGAVAPGLRVGDVVVAEALLQHDMDATPLFPRYEVPLLGVSRFVASPALGARLAAAADAFLRGLPQPDETSPVASGRRSRMHRGLIASGDRFVADRDVIAALRLALPDLLAVDMESAAVAQACHEHELPVAILRSISDAADEAAADSFTAFLRDSASAYAGGIVERFLDGEPR